MTCAQTPSSAPQWCVESPGPARNACSARLSSLGVGANLEVARREVARASGALDVPVDAVRNHVRLALRAQRRAARAARVQRTRRRVEHGARLDLVGGTDAKVALRVCQVAVLVHAVAADLCVAREAGVVRVVAVGAVARGVHAVRGARDNRVRRVAEAVGVGVGKPGRARRGVAAHALERIVTPSLRLPDLLQVALTRLRRFVEREARHALAHARVLQIAVDIRDLSHRRVALLVARVADGPVRRASSAERVLARRDDVRVARKLR
mmetsp:Transcript_17298/g.60816  ORF Transcript_17298/g.60816 Transcript_17298/m.60816 type:complete len:267 (+) Transcript_17298:96-896(+)